MKEQPLHPLSRDTKIRLFSDQTLNNQDRWALARTCKNFYDLLSHELLKNRVYSHNIIPDGLLDAPIFKKCRPNYRKLCEVLSSNITALVGMPLPHDKAWPLVALMGMEEALIELVDNDRYICVPGTNYTVAVLLVIGGHLDILKRWLYRAYGDRFNRRSEAYLLGFAIDYGQEEIVRYLTTPPLDYKFETDEDDKPLDTYDDLVRFLTGGLIDLFWERINEGVVFDNLIELAASAADVKQWKVCDELIRRSSQPLTEEEKTSLLFYAARDDHQRFLKLYDECKDFNLDELEVDEKKMLHFAIEGGNKETIEFIMANDEGAPTHAAFFIAALCGQIDLIDHFKQRPYSFFSYDGSTEYGFLDPCAARHGNWYKYELILEKYFPPVDQRCVEDFTERGRLSLYSAIKYGNLYFAQKFVKRFGNTLLQGDSGQAFLELAKENSECMVHWVEEQIKIANPQCEIYENSEIDNGFNP